MNGTTLKALRLALGFTQEEASNMIGAVSMRTWRYWEDEGRKIPDDVIATIRDLIRFKRMIVQQSCQQLEKMVKPLGEPARVAITYYSSLDDWMTQVGAEPAQWKPHSMAMGAVAEQFEFVELVAFDSLTYQK